MHGWYLHQTYIFGNHLGKLSDGSLHLRAMGQMTLILGGELSLEAWRFS